MAKFEISYDEITDNWEAGVYRREGEEDEESYELNIVSRTEPIALFFNDGLTTTEFWVVVEDTNLGDAFVSGWNKINDYIKENKITLNSQSK